MIITDSNFMLYAAKHYEGYDEAEFYEDIKRFKYIKRLLIKYIDNKELRERLILNHIVVLYNSFGIYATPMLFFKLKGFHEYLKPFIVLLGYMPNKIEGISDVPLYSSDIKMDPGLIDVLRKI